MVCGTGLQDLGQAWFLLVPGFVARWTETQTKLHKEKDRY